MKKALVDETKWGMRTHLPEQRDVLSVKRDLNVFFFSFKQVCVCTECEVKATSYWYKYTDCVPCGKLVSFKPLVEKQILLTKLHTFPKVQVSRIYWNVKTITLWRLFLSSPCVFLIYRLMLQEEFSSWSVTHHKSFDVSFCVSAFSPLSFSTHDLKRHPRREKEDRFFHEDKIHKPVKERKFTVTSRFKSDEGTTCSRTRNNMLFPSHSRAYVSKS